MKTDQQQNKLLETVIEVLSTSEDKMRPLLEAVLNAVESRTRSSIECTSPYERSGDRLGYSNGFKGKSLNSRMGKLELKIPQTHRVNFYHG